MKKYITLVIFIMIFLLSGCSTRPAEEPPQEVAEPTITEADLHQLFQEVFDFCGDIESESATQIINELAALRRTVDIDVLPEDYETLYKNWRSEKVAEHAKMIENLKAEYKQLLIQDAELVDLWDIHRNCYADYVDLNGDGIQELLTVSADGYNKNNASLKVYGSVDGYASQIAEETFDIDARWVELSLIKDNEDSSPYVKFYSNGAEGSGYFAGYECYYSLIGNEWKVLDELYEDYDSSNENGFSWISQGRTISNSEHDIISNKYSGNYEFNTDILRGDYQNGVLVQQYGILPETLKIIVKVNGEICDLNSSPFIEFGEFYGLNGNEDKYFMGEIQPVLDKMGVTFYKSPSGDLFLASTKEHTLEVCDYGRRDGTVIGEYYTNFDGEAIDGASFTAQIVDNQLLLPIDYISRYFGAECSFNSETRELSISSSILPSKKMDIAELEKMANFSWEDAIAVIEKQGYYHVDTDWDDLEQFQFGKKYWSMFVLANGVNLEYNEDGMTSNAIRVKVSNNGDII